MTKTIALSEATWEKLKRIKEIERASTFPEVIEKLIQKTSDMPKSMFGIDKRLKPLTQKEHKEFLKDHET
jgi:predicted CopG family antitoxin